MSSQTDQVSVEEIDSMAITTQTPPPTPFSDDNVFVEQSNRISGRLE